MGYQLWVSPITGYRRRGTRLSELRSLLADGITARTLLEPLQSCPADAPAGEMRDILRKRDFDVAGVQATQDGPIIGFITRQSLTDGHIRDHTQSFAISSLVSEATPLPTLLKSLMRSERAFVLTGSEIGGIVTRADLNKPPVRVYLFGLVSLLEMHLQFWIREEYVGDSWQSQLSASRITKAKQLYDQRRAVNDEVALIDCLQFCDKRDLILKNKDLVNALQLGAPNEARELLKRAEDLRNLLAHSQYDIRGAGWQMLISLVETLELFLHHSDEMVEERARQRAAHFENHVFVAGP